MFKRIAKAISIYTFFCLIETLVFSLLLYYLSGNAIQLDFQLFLLDQLTERAHIIIGSQFIPIYFLQKIIEASALAVLTSYIFAYILNREPVLIFPKKLVIRHRTSWESQNKLTLGILVGNKSHFPIHNIVCSITCTYIKQTEPLLINSEITLSDERTVLENFYRFSFDLTKFPRKILKDIIDKPEYYDQDTISVCITGNCNYLGNSFRKIIKYKLSDIVFDEHVPNISSTRKNKITGNELVTPFSKKPIKKIHWDEIVRVVEVDENSRNSTVKEIKKIIRNMKH